MKKLIFICLVSISVVSCGSRGQKDRTKNDGGFTETKFYSKDIKDTFSVFVSVPEKAVSAGEKYPVVYLLDANLYFDIMATTFKKYSEAGLLRPAILVGIGYKDFKNMDSLRTRDLTYPVAIPEYEMTSSGKADKFLAFIKKEIIPSIDKNYSSDKKNRVLMGHSLGGYFTLYALNQGLVNKDSTFNSYIAASPSLEYNHNYILDQFDRMEAEGNSPTKAYITFGGLEDAEDGGDPSESKTSDLLSYLTLSLKSKKNMHCRGDVYSNLGHMDTPLPSFVRGLQWALNMTE